MSTKLDIEVVPLSEIKRGDGPISQPVILVVDDEKVIADTLSVILSQNGFTVLTAYDGEGALELARMARPNLLLTDVMMPGMTGIELAIRCTEADPMCKVLLFSGQAATVDLLENAKRQGHNFNVLLKPIHPSDLLRCISGCLTGGDTLTQGTGSAFIASSHCEDGFSKERGEVAAVFHGDRNA